MSQKATGFTPAGKIIALIVIAGAAFGLFKVFSGGNLLGFLAPGAKTKESTDIKKIELPSSIGDAQPAAVDHKIPGDRTVSSGEPEIRFLVWAWNAQLGGLFSNGGARTTEGSLMSKNNVNLRFTRQDDVSKMQEELVTFATELNKGNSNPTKGSHFIAIMGDGAAAFFAGLNPVLARLGPEYKAKVVGSMGYSRGEDKFMGPASWKQNPRSAMGGVVAGYLRDGDWNIAMKWLGDNGLKNNPDEKTYDPDALNWVAANDYIDAAEKYVAGYTEERIVVKNGKPTGEKKKITVDAIVTWTPGDVTAAQKRGGIVSIVSTREYASQMPNVIIGIDKWMRDNQVTVQNMLYSFFQGGDSVMQYEDAFDHACKISADVYNEQGANAEYWAKYFRGVTETDKQGNSVQLGGSKVNNLSDNLVLFGLTSGAANRFEATYTVFGDIVKQQYPELVPSYPPVNEILDTTYLRKLMAKHGEGATSVATTIRSDQKPPKPIKGAGIGNRVYDIKFNTGRADFTGSAQRELQRLLRDLVIASNTVVEIHGHTDNVGNADSNMKLSESRAFAVKKWLESKASRDFPEGRLKVIAHGQTEPAAENSSEAGKAKNRRVVIKTFGVNN